MSKDIIVVRVDGCATIAGFRESVAKSLKIFKVDYMDERSIGSVVRQFKHEVRSIKYNSANYDLPPEFTQMKLAPIFQYELCPIPPRSSMSMAA